MTNLPPDQPQYLPPQPQQPQPPQYAQPVPPQQYPPQGYPAQGYEQQQPQGYGQQPPVVGGQGGPPVGPPAGPPRRGLPVWAWVIIGAVVALFIGLIIAMAVFVSQMFSGIDTLGQPEPRVTPPVPTEEYVPEEEPAAGTLFTLDDKVDFDDALFWGVGFDEAWNIEIWDTEGVNQLSDPASGCSLYTYQGFGVPEAEGASSDRDATEQTISVALQMGLPWEATGSPEVKPDGERALKYNFGPDEIEMQQLRAQYTGTAGDARERVFLLRAFTPRNNVLLAQLDCPAGAPELEQRLDDLGISEF